MWMIPGAKASQLICNRLKNFVPNGLVNPCYGSTECDFITTNYNGKKLGSCGQVFYNNQIKIIDDNGNALSNNQQGEICVKKVLEFTGYYDEPEKIKEVYDGEWFKTGDIGYFDDEGYLYIVDRKKELLKYNYMQVAPSELEAIINEIDGVVSSCVVGVLDENTGNDIIHAFVIVDETKNLTETQIENFVNSKVIDIKKLRGGVHFVEKFPLTASGKVYRKELKNMAAEKFTK